MGSKKAAPTTGTSRRSATTRCFCSPITVTAWRRSCDPATSPARTNGRNCSCPRSTASRPRDSASRSGPTPPSRGRRSTKRWRRAASSTRSGYRQTRTWSWRSKTSCFGHRDGPSLKPLIRYQSFQYQADSWTTPRRVVAKVEHHVGELFPRVGFIVTNLPIHNRAVVRFYNKRGTAEQWIKEGKQATHWTRLSCHRFRANEVRLQLSVLSYNLGNLWRRLVLPTRIERWSLTSLQQRLVKTGRAVGKTRALLLAVPGGESPDPTPVRGDAPADLGATGPGRLTRGECKDAGLAKPRTQMRSGVEGIPWKHGPPARDTSARAGVTAFGPGRWCDEHNLVGSAALGCINGHPGQAKRKSRLRAWRPRSNEGAMKKDAIHGRADGHDPPGGRHQAGPGRGEKARRQRPDDL